MLYSADRRQLHDVDFDVGVIEGRHLSVSLLAFHRKQTDFTFQRVAFLDHAAGHQLMIPDHVGQVERDLLSRFVLTMSAIFLTSTGGGLKNLAKPLWPGTLMQTRIIERVVAFQQLLERIGNQFLGHRLGLTENLGVLDVIKGIGNDFAVLQRTMQRLQRRLSDLDSPNA